jgi:hypothetical protein
MKKQLNALHRKAQQAKKKAWFMYKKMQKATSEIERDIARAMGESAANECRSARNQIRELLEAEEERNNAAVDAYLAEIID